MDNALKDIADEYLRLGGHRRAVIDDNLMSTRSWEDDTPEAERFWKSKVETLDKNSRTQVFSFLPTINAV